ncbi:MAG: hypothetical protein KC933_22935 [Myxococcales bacterium]|nr:hypothetical protein [Myxococcales bacterium]
MPRTELSSVIAGVPSLNAMFITVMPDCLLYDSWVRSGLDWDPEQVASFFGDLIRANREGLKALRSWSSEMQVTIESADLLLVLAEIREDFVVAFAFERSAPLGMVRLHVRRVMQQLQELLPKIEIKERPRAVRIIEFLQRYAPDPHAVLFRVSLRMGLDVDELKDPTALTPDEVELLETSVKELLNLERLAV